MKKFGLLIGVERYRDKRIAPLHFAAADATALATQLRDRCSFYRTIVLADRGGDEKPNAWNISNALEELKNELEDDDLFLFFFSGHGIDVDGRSYLLTRDSRLAFPEQISLSLDTLRKSLERLTAKKRVLILDCCRNDPAAGKGELGNQMTKSLSNAMNAIAKTRKAHGATTALLSACGPGQRAYEWPEKGHGVLTHFLLEGLDGPAWTAAGLDVKDLRDFAFQRIRSWVSKNCELADPQEPWYEENGIGAPILLADSAVAAAANVDLAGKPERLLAAASDDLVLRRHLVDWLVARGGNDARQEEVLSLYGEWAEQHPEWVRGVRPSRLCELAAQAHRIVLDDRAWTYAAQLNSEESYGGYLEREGARAYASDATTRIRKLRQDREERDRREAELWRQAEAADAIAIYEMYLNDTPLHLHDEQANQSILRLQEAAVAAADDIRWATACQADTIRGYQGYLQLGIDTGLRREDANQPTPAQRYPALAQRRIEELQEIRRRAEHDTRNAIAEGRFDDARRMVSHAPPSWTSEPAFEEFNASLVHLEQSFSRSLSISRDAVERQDWRASIKPVVEALRTCPCSKPAIDLRNHIRKQIRDARSNFRSAKNLFKEAKFTDARIAGESAWAIAPTLRGLESFLAQSRLAEAEYEQHISKARELEGAGRLNEAIDSSRQASVVCPAASDAKAIVKRCNESLQREREKLFLVQRRHARIKHISILVPVALLVVALGYLCFKALSYWGTLTWIAQYPGSTIKLSLPSFLLVGLVVFREWYFHDSWHRFHSKYWFLCRPSGWWEPENNRQRITKSFFILAFLCNSALLGCCCFSWFCISVIPEIQMDYGRSAFWASTAYAVSSAMLLCYCLGVRDKDLFEDHEWLRRGCDWGLGVVTVITFVAAGLIGWTWLSNIRGFGGVSCVALIFAAGLVLPAILSLLLIFVGGLLWGAITGFIESIRRE